LYSFQYSKVIATILSAAVLAGLQSIMVAGPVQAETTCQLHSRAAATHSHWRRTGAATADRCAVRARRTKLVRNQAAPEEAHAELGATAAHPDIGQTPAPVEVGEAAAQAQVSEALEEQRPNAPHCVVAPGRPFRRGAWELGIDRATGSRCWRLVGVIKPHARIASRAKSSHVPKSAAPSPRLTTATAGPIATPTGVDAHRQGQPSEVLTGSVTNPSKSQAVNLGQSPATAADAISKPSEVDRGELPLFDQRFARTADRGSVGPSAALVAIDTDSAKFAPGNMLEGIGPLIPVRGRAALFLIVFLSVLATITTLYALIIGSVRLLRPRARRDGAAVIRVTPPHYLENMTARERFTDESRRPRQTRGLYSNEP